MVESKSKPIRLWAASFGVLCLILLLLAPGASPGTDRPHHATGEVHLPPGRPLSQNVVANGGFEEDFASWTQVQDVSISTSTVHSGGKALQTTDPDATRFAYVWQQLGLDYGMDDITVWVYPESATYRSHFGLIHGWNTPDAVYTTLLEFRDNTIIFVVPGANENVATALTPNAWNKVVIRVDATTLIQELYLNDMLVSSLTATSFPTVEHMLVGDLSGAADFGTVYYDDISVVGTGTNNPICPFQGDPVLAVEDETFADADWVTELVTNTPASNPWTLDIAIQAFDTPYAHYPDPGNPVPGRWVRYVYNGSPDQGAEVEAATWYAASIVPPAEGLQAIQFDFDTWGNSQHLGPMILQGGTYYRGPTFVATRTPGWAAYSSGCLTADDFERRAGPGPEEPDLSQPFVVGYSLANTSNLAFDLRDHLLDNFRVFVDGAATLGDPPPIPNRAPFAITDVIVADKNAFNTYIGGTNAVLNDVDPDGDPLKVIGVTQPLYGFQATFTDTHVSYNSGSDPVSASDAFRYTITDGEFTASAQVQVVLDDCTFGAMAAGATGRRAKTADLDLTLIRRFRDEVMKPTADGARYVDHYYTTTAEIVKILVIDRPDLRTRALGMVELLQPAIADRLDGDGTLPITQTQMDTVAAFFEDLAVSGSRSLQQLIADELDRLGPLDAYVGLPVGDVLEAVLGERTGTAIEDEAPAAPTDLVLEQNFPNPFAAETEIRYALSRSTAVSLVIYDLQGRRVRTLVDGQQGQGVQSVTWDGKDDGGAAVPSGLYFVRLTAPSLQQSKKMVVMK